MEQQEARLDKEALLQEAWDSRYTVAVRQFEEIPTDVGN